MKKIPANGVEIPVLGFGTWTLQGDQARQMVREAIRIGYRHIDTAQAYDNEAEVGQGLKDSGIGRDEVFVTTKVWIERFRYGDLQPSVRQSLERLKLDHVDLLLLHWPNPDVPLEETLKALNEVKDEGLTRAIGISNFPTRLMREAVETSKAPIAVNQVECHPYLDQSKVLAEAKKLGMAITAYSPLARGDVFDEPMLEMIGKPHEKSPAQVALRWLVQQDIIAIPKSSSAEHAQSNFDIFDFELSEAEMAEIGKLKRPDGRKVDPDFAPRWD